MTTESADRLIIGISGASGVQYGVRALELLKLEEFERPDAVLHAGGAADTNDQSVRGFSRHGIP